MVIVEIKCSVKNCFARPALATGKYPQHFCLNTSSGRIDFVLRIAVVG
jgi:hypothetical protein